MVVENDANAAAWAESRFKWAGRGLTTWSRSRSGRHRRGDRAGRFRCTRGRVGAAGEFGHLNVDPRDDRPVAAVAAGSSTPAATLWSGGAIPGLERRAEAETLLDLGTAPPRGVQGLHVTQAARKGDPVALAA